MIIHYYRGEIGRMTSWRDRIDRTSNWSMTVVAGLLSVSLSTPASHHGVVLFAMLLVSLFLLIEARRYHEARRALDLIETAAILEPRDSPAAAIARNVAGRGIGIERSLRCEGRCAAG